MDVSFLYLVTAQHLLTCDGVDCNGRGKCRASLNNTLACQCTAPYMGHRCEHTRDGVCRTNKPCQNDGDCIDMGTVGEHKYRCECSGKWTGSTCTEENLCFNNSCGPEATCVASATGYECQCKTGYTGKTCDVALAPTTSKDGCSSSPCLNGGTCKPGSPFVCHCPRGWTGSKCESRVYRCTEKNYCTHGTCKDVLPEIDSRLYICQCHYGWDGTKCENQINFCSRDDLCQNNATCTLLQEGGYRCDCLEGFEGENCSTAIDYCNRSQCHVEHTRSCSNTRGGYQCTCKRGFEGKDCRKFTDYCISQPCLNGGTCVNAKDNYTCACGEHFEGDHCEKPAGACTYNGDKKTVEDQWEVNCNVCNCGPNRSHVCTKLWCGWKQCVSSNQTTTSESSCETCIIPTCVTGSCPHTQLCYDGARMGIRCAEDCINLTIQVNTDNLGPGSDEEVLCQKLRKMLLLEKEKLMDSPVRMECQWSENLKLAHLAVMTEGNPELTNVVTDVLKGLIDKTHDGLITDVRKSHHKAAEEKTKNLLDVLIPFGVSFVVISAIVFVIIIVMKTRKKDEDVTPRDKWITKSRKIRTKSKEDPIAFQNQTYGFDSLQRLSADENAVRAPPEGASIYESPQMQEETVSCNSSAYAIVGSGQTVSPLSESTSQEKDEANARKSSRHSRSSNQFLDSGYSLAFQSLSSDVTDNCSTSNAGSVYDVPTNNTLIANNSRVHSQRIQSYPLSRNGESHYDTPRSLKDFRASTEMDYSHHQSSSTEGTNSSDDFPPPPSPIA